jgi:hypothetical protein
LRFREEVLRHNPGFQGIQELDIKIEEISRRKQLERFEIMNSEFSVEKYSRQTRQISKPFNALHTNSAMLRVSIFCSYPMNGSSSVESL